MSPLLSGPLFQDALMQAKPLEPLSDASQETVARIESFDVTDWNEETVREEIISPLLGLLSYDIATDFSIERGKAIKLPGRNKFLDYGLVLWSRNYWLIEAKSPKKEPKNSFSPKTIEQAVFYAAHPDINAALVVLCDGRKIAVYDREQSLVEPVALVKLSELGQSIDHLRLLLEPWQVWLFEKRRVTRHLDRVFDREFNAGRLEEFRSLVSDRLDSKRRAVVDNMRMIMADADDPEADIRAIESSQPDELVNGWFYLPQTRPATKAIARTLTKQCEQDSSTLLRSIFPDQLHPLNDHYCVHALNLLLHLDTQGQRRKRVPAWLGGDLETAIRTYIDRCLTLFAEDPGRRVILLYATAARRTAKLRMVLDPTHQEIGRLLHALTRYGASEDSWAQLLSSPERELLLALDGLVVEDVSRFLRRCVDRSGAPNVKLLQSDLRGIWALERQILKRAPSYPTLVDARGMEEIGYATEDTGVSFDWLAHGALYVIHDHPRWKNHVLNAHEEHLEVLARMGSGEACKWLDGGVPVSRPALSNQAMADRFFLGDADTYRHLRAAYNTR